MPNEPAEEPKLIIDEDWKSQVQREKEELKQKESTQESPATDADAQSDSESTATASTQDAAEAAALGPPPPATLTLLVSTLATQAMAAMGLLPDEKGKPQPINLDFARHFIDLIGVIDEKTQGNLSDEEKSLVRDALHQLRMAFVAVNKQPQSK